MSSGENIVTSTAQQFVVAPYRLTVEPDLVPTGQVDLGLDQQAPAFAVGLGPEHRLLSAFRTIELAGAPRKLCNSAR